MKPVAVAAALSLLVVAGCGGNGDGGDEEEGSGAPRAATVDIAEFKFKPPTVRVASGGNVTFTNGDRASHTATAAEGAPADFDTDRLEQGSSKTIPFGDPGRYAYVCTFHPYMKGTIEVE